MAQPPVESPQSREFPEIGLPPGDRPPPPDKVRCFFSPGRVAVQYVSTVVVVALGVGLTVLFALTMGAPLNVLAAVTTGLVFAAAVYFATRHDYRWIELEGDTLRAKHLYSRRVLERPVGEIDHLGTLVRPGVTAGTAVAQMLLGRVKAVEIRFRDGLTPLRVQLSDPAMTHAREVIEGVLYRMARIGETETQVVPFEGSPLVRAVYWKGERPPATRNNLGKLLGVCLIIMGLLFGTILGYWGSQEQQRRRWASVPPHEMKLRSLASDGPGANRHVTITDFRPGGYVAETQGGGPWRNVWVALFPAGAGPGEAPEIRVVLESGVAGDEAELDRLLRSGRVSGVCRESPRTGWGTELGPQLRRANPGCRLSSALVVEELREPPAEAAVKAKLAGSAGCFAAALLAVMVLLLKR